MLYEGENKIFLKFKLNLDPFQVEIQSLCTA